MLYPLLFRPIFQERIWGGRNLEKLYHKPLPPDVRIGESWEISDRDGAQSVIANGPLVGKTLRWLMENHERELLGNAKSLNGRFPLLVKILDAEEKLSLQVHPPAEKARAFRGEPKSEMWYITQAQPGAELYVGLKPGTTRSEFEAKIKTGHVADCFHRIPVQTGDAMFLPSGRVHAIGAGLVLFEIQQNSDTTFRVFDWNRTDAAGNPRQLHVAESLESIDFADFAPHVIKPSGERQTLVNDPLFCVQRLDLPRASAHQLSFRAAQVLAVTEGALRLGDLELSPGSFCLLPASLKTVRVDALAPTRLLLALPGE